MLDIATLNSSTMEVDKPGTESHGFGMLRIDLQDSLQQTALDPRHLSSFQRILLTTDGTVTEILEAQLWETIKLVKLHQNIIVTETAIPYLDSPEGTTALVRKVLLRGKYSHKNYIYAESITLPERLDAQLREGLLNTQKPIGRLMLEARTETFREILSCNLEEIGDIAGYFALPTDAKLISRTYRVFIHGQAAMLITEKFPESHFKD